MGKPLKASKRTYDSGLQLIRAKYYFAANTIGFDMGPYLFGWI